MSDARPIDPTTRSKTTKLMRKSVLESCAPLHGFGCPPPAVQARTERRGCCRSCWDLSHNLSAAAHEHGVPLIFSAMVTR